MNMNPMSMLRRLFAEAKKSTEGAAGMKSYFGGSGMMRGVAGFNPHNGMFKINRRQALKLRAYKKNKVNMKGRNS